MIHFISNLSTAANIFRIGTYIIYLYTNLYENNIENEIYVIGTQITHRSKE